MTAAGQLVPTEPLGGKLHPRQSALWLTDAMKFVEIHQPGTSYHVDEVGEFLIAQEHLERLEGLPDHPYTRAGWVARRAELHTKIREAAQHPSMRIPVYIYENRIDCKWHVIRLEEALGHARMFKRLSGALNLFDERVRQMLRGINWDQAPPVVRKLAKVVRDDAEGLRNQMDRELRRTIERLEQHRQIIVSEMIQSRLGHAGTPANLSLPHENDLPDGGDVNPS